MLKDKIVRRLYSNNKMFTHFFFEEKCMHVIKIFKSKKTMFKLTVTETLLSTIISTHDRRHE